MKNRSGVSWNGFFYVLIEVVQSHSLVVVL